MAAIRLGNRMRVATISSSTPDVLTTAVGGTLKVYGTNSIALYKTGNDGATYDTSADIDKLLLIQNDKIELEPNKSFDAQAISGDTTILWMPRSTGRFL